MAVSDYVFKSEGKKIYLSKQLKGDGISKDSRELTSNEIVALFTFYFRNYCVENKCDGMTIRVDGKNLYEVKLCEEEKKDEKIEELAKQMTKEETKKDGR